MTQSLIQSRGYNAISFNDIAEQVGIKKPSIVHHYSSKAVLGQAVVQRYRKGFSQALNDFFENKENTPLDAFNFYCVPYLDFGKEGDKVCLCAALAGEFMALPKSMQKEVQAFFESHTQWLESILNAGIESADFSFDEEPVEMAQLILDSLQGSLIVKRSTGNAEHIENAVKLLSKRIMTNK